MRSGFLIDTNIPSELTYPLPNPHVKEWIAAHPNLHLSVISIGELRKGFRLLPEGKRRSELENWLDRFLLPLIGRRVLPITHAIADRWGILSAERRLMGKPLNTSDGLIAATAIEHDLTIVTRNVKDFSGLDLAIVNPWEV